MNYFFLPDPWDFESSPHWAKWGRVEVETLTIGSCSLQTWECSEQWRAFVVIFLEERHTKRWKKFKLTKKKILFYEYIVLKG